ncbi:MAG: hypothetical protein K2X11_06730 [Acetobacteraceae bacterium]|nr:hypothetical protein [Acetobacteraceae bacterium]
MRSLLETYADLSIRRACGFVGLAIITVMVALSFEMSLSLRVGAEMSAFLCIGLALAGWRAPYRNLRHSEIYALLKDAGLPRGRLSTAEMQEEMGQVLRERLYWHADWVGVAALVLWTAAALAWMVG